MILIVFPKLFPTKMSNLVNAKRKRKEKQGKISERSGRREKRRLKVKTGTVQCVFFLPPAHIFNMSGLGKLIFSFRNKKQHSA